MVNRIISNKVYIGVLEQGKTTKLNYKSKHEVDVSKEDWIAIENAHESIVSKSIFTLANKILLCDVRQSKDKPYILSGLLYCKDCGSPMIRRKVRDKIFYICSEYNNTGECSRHSVKEDYVTHATIHALNEYLSKYNELLKKVSEIDVSKFTLKVDFESLNAEKRKYERLRQSLYMDLEEELITTEEFERFRKNYLIKIREIEKQIITKQNIVEELKMKINDKGSFVSEIVPNPESDELNRLSLVSFIDCIEIGEDNAINFVFNNIETVNLLQAVVDSDKVKAKDTNKASLISMGKLFDEHIERAELKLATVKDLDSKKSFEVTLKNIVNDMYAKDISVKIKTSKHNRARNGYFIGSVPPYGYKVVKLKEGQKLNFDENVRFIVE